MTNDARPRNIKLISWVRETQMLPHPDRSDSLGWLYCKSLDGTEEIHAVPVSDTTMWQDDEDNNPYGSFNQDSAGTANPTLGASCKRFYPSSRRYSLTLMCRPRTA